MSAHRLLLLLIGMVACSSGTGPSLSRGWESIQVSYQDNSIIMERVTYRVSGLLVQGQVCRPTASGPHPLIVFNHGGWQGLTTEFDPVTGLCPNLARNGYVTAESSYRGEDGSEGVVEICAGEIQDAAAMLALARTERFVDSSRIGMLGGSHGGCITYGVLSLGARAGRTVVVAGPTDFADTWQRLADSLQLNPASPRAGAWQYITDGLLLYIGGPPDSLPAA